MAGFKRPGDGRIPPKQRFLIDSDTPVIRVMGNSRRFYWAVKDEDGSYRRIDNSEWELR